MIYVILKQYIRYAIYYVVSSATAHDIFAFKRIRPLPASIRPMLPLVCNIHACNWEKSSAGRALATQQPRDFPIWCNANPEVDPPGHVLWILAATIPWLKAPRRVWGFLPAERAPSWVWFSQALERLCLIVRYSFYALFVNKWLCQLEYIVSCRMLW